MLGALLVSLVSTLALAGSAGAQKVDGIPGKAATAPVNLQLIPTDAFVRIRGWSLPAPVLPLAVMGSWGGKGTITGAGNVNIPQGQISAPTDFSFKKDINGEEEDMIVSLSARGDWNGTVNPLDGDAVMSMPTTLRIRASHVRMVDIPWPGGWIYGNIDCTVGLDFGPMKTGQMDPPDPMPDPAPVTKGSPYDPATGQFSAINNSMTTGGFDCTHPDIGGGEVEDELNEAVNIPAPAGRMDSKFNLTFLEGGNIIRPKPAIRPAFTGLPGEPLSVAFSARGTYAKAGVHLYLWDLDGDGKQETATKGPDVTHAFPAAGYHAVGMRIIDKDGDVSSWSYRFINATTRAGSGVPKLAPLRILPRMRKARPGSKVKFKVRVRNSGKATATGVKVCLKSKKGMVKGKKCRKAGDLAPGQTKTRAFKLKVARKAAGRNRVPLRFKATAGPKYTGKGRARIRIV